MPKTMKFWGAALSLICASVGGAQSRDTTVVTALDFAFQAPMSIRAGTHTFLMANRGREMHMIVIIRITGNHTASELMTLILKGAPPTKWAKGIGGPNMVAPGDTSNATLVMTPGRYVMTCWVAAADGAPHVMKGMYREIVVTPVARANYTEPKPTSVIRLSNFRIDTSWPARIGLNTFRVFNAGPLEHDVQIVKIKPGRTEAEVLKWLENLRGPVAVPDAPAIAVGGLTGIEKDGVGYFSALFTRGTYLLVCWVPDENGKPHFRHGMVRRFSLL